MTLSHSCMRKEAIGLQVDIQEQLVKEAITDVL